MPNQVTIFLTPLVFVILDTLANQNVVHGAAALPTSGNLVETHNPKSHHRSTVSESAFYKILHDVYTHYI